MPDVRLQPRCKQQSLTVLLCRFVNGSSNLAEACCIQFSHRPYRPQTNSHDASCDATKTKRRREFLHVAQVNIHQMPAAHLSATASTPAGLVLAIASNVLVAVRLGCLRPCSEPWSVRTDMPMSLANFDCDRSVFLRVSRVENYCRPPAISAIISG